MEMSASLDRFSSSAPGIARQVQGRATDSGPQLLMTALALYLKASLESGRKKQRSFFLAPRDVKQKVLRGRTDDVRHDAAEHMLPRCVIDEVAAVLPDEGLISHF